MTKGLGLRQYRACVRCRSRKTRCDLYVSNAAISGLQQVEPRVRRLLLTTGARRGIGDPNKPPCVKCNREGAECVLAPSRRGGDYSHFRRQKRHSAPIQENEAPSIPALSISSPENGSRYSTSGDHVHDNLQNPSDALLILASAAGQPEDQVQAEADSDNRHLLDGNASNVSLRIPGKQHIQAHGRIGDISANAPGRESISHPLIDNGAISLPLLLELLSSYAHTLLSIYR